MERFVDTHCHILPGVDDGAQTVEEMQQMLRMAYEDGIRYIIATPHHHPRRGRKSPGALRAQLKAAREEAAKISGELRIYLGTEVYFGQDIPDMLRAGKILTMNRTDLVLAEFSTSDPFDYICQGIQQLQMKGYEVILAHVERYSCMYKSPDNAEHLTHMGVRLQVNADSITGGSGWKAKRFTRKLWNAGWYSVWAPTPTMRQSVRRACVRPRNTWKRNAEKNMRGGYSSAMREPC